MSRPAIDASAYWDGFWIGFSGLTLHKMRSGLTMLGIIVGVAAVIAMTAIGAGAKEETRRQIESYGATTLFVRAIKVSADVFLNARQALSTGLSASDVRYLREALPCVTSLAAEAILDKKVRYAGREPKSQVVGVEPEYFALTHQRPARGRLLMDQDVAGRRQVCVLGARLARELFLQEDALGKTVSVGMLRVTVVGVVKMPPLAGEASAASSPSAAVAAIKDREIERDLYLPLPVALELFWKRRQFTDSFADPTYHRIRELIVQVASTELVPATKAALRKVLVRRHGGAEDFEVVAPLEVLEQSRKAQEIFNLVMALIAGLSLVVGGIGIMNIMLATVTERTREIGIRRAMGATERDILIQFLMEATLLSVTGGLLGIGLGVGLSRGVGAMLGWRTLTTPASILLAFGVSALVGIVFGLFPARVAARRDPIDALRAN